MKVSKKWKIGTHFKKEKIVLATISASNIDAKQMIKSKLENGYLEDFYEWLVEKGIIFSEKFGIFYKTDKGYIRFEKNGPETFAGDNSDGKGTIHNVVSIWEYYSENLVYECILNNKYIAICVSDKEPLNKYNENYNKA